MTIIDTPGFGDDLANEEKTIDELVDVLKNQVKFVHVFVIAFNGESPRMTFSLKSMIRLFEKMFGNLFWNNALFEVTRWHFDARSAKNRQERGESEQKWEYEWDKKFHDLFDMRQSTSMKALFIDTFYEASNPFEVGKFSDYTSQLWEFAQTVQPFECKDIKTALTELMEAMQNIDALKDQLNDAKEELEANRGTTEVCLAWALCFNPPQFGSFGFAMFATGCIISILIVCCCQKWCLNTCSCCVPGELRN